MYTHMYYCMYIHVYIRVCVYIRVYTYIYIYIYIHTYMHMCLSIHPSRGKNAKQVGISYRKGNASEAMQYPDRHTRLVASSGPPSQVKTEG